MLKSNWFGTIPMGQSGTSKETSNFLNPNSATKPLDNKAMTEAIKSLKEYTEEEVSQHKSSEDAWIIIKGYVFDITHYHHSHPGGSKFLLAKAGVDATEDFEALRHSVRA